MAGCGASGLIKARVAESPRTFCNPVNVDYRFMKIDGGDGIREAADPVVVEFGGRYYLFASKSSGYWHTEDFVEWTHVLIDDTVLPPPACLSTTATSTTSGRRTARACSTVRRHPRRACGSR